MLFNVNKIFFCVFSALILLVLTSFNGDALNMAEKSSTNLQRDIMAVDTVTNFGLTLKCLLDVVGDADIISAVYDALGGTVLRAQQIPPNALINMHYMDIVNQQTSLSVAALSSIHPVCSNIFSYCQHRNDFTKFVSPQELEDLQMYLSLTGPVAKCLMNNYGEGVSDKIYEVFQKAVSGIRTEIDVNTTTAQMILLQARAITTELLKLDNKCRQIALNYDHCAEVAQKGTFKV